MAADALIESELECHIALHRAFRYGPARACLLKYALIEKCGGVWLDLKSWWSKPEYHLKKFAPLPPLVFCGRGLPWACLNIYNSSQLGLS